jgi:energy-coupling factor transporter ATP-binding protein EcfA2
VVEGNIGSGKSTFLKFLNQTLPNTINVFYEPVDQWRNLNGHNLFELMYRDPTRWSFTFQTYVQLTMMKMHDSIRSNCSSAPRKPVELRKVLSCKAPEVSESSEESGARTVKRKRTTLNRLQHKEPEDDLSDCLSSELKQELRIQLQDENHRHLNVMERSIFSARFIFIENLFQSYVIDQISITLVGELVINRFILLSDRYCPKWNT